MAAGIDVKAGNGSLFNESSKPTAPANQLEIQLERDYPSPLISREEARKIALMLISDKKNQS